MNTSTDSNGTGAPVLPSGGSCIGLDALAHHQVLTSGAMEFLASLHRLIEPHRKQLLARREERQKVLDAGGLLNFPEDSDGIRSGTWQVASIPSDLLDRRVEITGPTDRKMIINAMNSGARVFMADFEDATSPLWRTMIEGQRNLMDAVRRTISVRDSRSNAEKFLVPSPAVLIVRPRGWHMVETHFVVDGEPISASLFDAGLYVYHNARELIARGTGPYLYLPKLEGQVEARTWEAVLSQMETLLGLQAGTIKVTVLIETLPAAFEMEEILYELRQRIVGLNCGRWDYLFSAIKRMKMHAEWVLPDRSQVTMASHFMRSYSTLLIQVCHRRGALAIGGMAAQIPIKNDPSAHEAALRKVAADKEREVLNGHDGTWVAHPALVPVALAEFDKVMTGANQLGCLRDDVVVTAADLLTVPAGTITEVGVRENLRAAVQYIAAWLSGRGAVALNNLMEDAATAEISRSQLWQWRHHAIVLDDGRSVNAPFIERLLQEELNGLAVTVGEPWAVHLHIAAEIVRALVFSETFEEFLTTPAYDALLLMERRHEGW